MYDSQGRAIGLVNGEVSEEIPNSAYDNESKTILIFNSTDLHYCRIVGSDNGTYGLSITSVENGMSQTFARTNVSISTNATHQYTINWSDHEATVRIDADGDGTFEQNVTLKQPVASFTYIPENPVVNQTITFNASSSYDPDGTIVSYKWDFGDGNITSTTEPIITHSYASAGDYIVNLKVADNYGATNSTNKTVTVYPSTPVLVLISVSPPAVTLNVNDTQHFNATAYDRFGNAMPGIVFDWTSSNTTVGTIDQNGLFTARAIGNTTITATNGTVSGTANVTVIKLEVFIDSYELCLNREIVIPIKIKDATDIAGGSLAITYNASIINAVSVSGGHFGEPAYNIDNPNGRVSLACAKTYAVNRTEAVLANIVFKGMKEGFTPLRIENAILNDEEGNVIYPGTSNGSITVRSYMLGDVNYNNMLDTGDVTLVLRMIVGLKEQDMLGDMNDNGMIDTGDATLVLRKVVGLL